MLHAAINDISGIDWTICGIYLAAVVALGVYFSRTEDTNDEFFHGGKSMHWLPVGLSLFATTFSSNSFVGLPAEGAFGDYHQLLAIFFIPFIVIPIACKWFIPLYKSWGYDSLYEYFEHRFNRRIRLMASSVFMFYSAGWMATMLLAVARVLGEVLETSEPLHAALIIFIVGLLATAYTAMGGVKAVIWTDTIQAFALGGGMVLLFFALLGDIEGGWAGYLEVAARDSKMNMTSLTGGLAEHNFSAACAYGFFLYMGGQLATYGAYQRYITVETVKEAQLSLGVKGIFTLFSCGLFFLVGTALYVFYQQDTSTAEIFNAYDTGATKDRLLPNYVMNHLQGVGITGLLLAGLFAAAMSSLDSGINSMTATLVTDWYNGKNMGKGVNRKLTLYFGLAVTFVGAAMAFINAPVFDILVSVAGVTLGLLLSVLLVGLFYRKATTVGAICGMASGLFVYAVIRLFIGKLASPEFVESLGLIGGLAHNTWWDAMITTCTSIIVMTIVSTFTYKSVVVDESLLMRRTSSKHLSEVKSGIDA